MADFHRKLDKLINNFLWRDKRARISLPKLRLNKKLGGLNLTNFKTFQTACLARHGAYWLTPKQEYTPVWLEVERAMLDGLDPLALLTANKHPEATNIILKNTKNALLKVDPKMQTSIRNTKWESLWTNTKVKYKGKTLSFSSWSELGISTPNHLEENTPHTFAYLKQLHNLPDIEFYNFLKIKAALTRADLSKEVQSILQYMTNLNKIGHHTSHLYKLLSPSTSRLNAKIISYWEEQRNSPFSEAERQQLWTSASKNKVSPTLAQTKYWLIHKNYWTPARLATVGLRNSDLCWNCHGQKGDLSHLIFHCPKVRTFWVKVREFIHNSLGYSLPTDFHSLVTAFMAAEIHSQNDSHLLDLLLTAAVKTILANWKDTRKVTFKSWFNWITFLRGADNITLKYSGETRSNREMWHTLDSFLGSHKPP